MTELSGVHNYTYDSIYQLIQVTHPAMPTEQYGYDSVGNRISADGELVGTPMATSYTYDWGNRLIKLEYSGTVAQYKYDPFGRRIEKNVNGDITRYVYDGANIVTEYDGKGNVKNAYIHNLAIDDPLAVQQGANIYYYHKDGLGSVTELSDASGNTIKTYRYKSFGEVYLETGSVVQPFTFTGREYDPESGLYYYRARYYDPRAGRFLTKDPIGFSGGDVNLYRYVENNVLNWKDPSGYLSVPFTKIWIPAGEQSGEEAAMYWAAKSIDLTNTWYQTAFYNLMGGLSSLWTPCTSDVTFSVLSAFAGFRFQGIPVEPIHYGFDIPFTKFNIIHYGTHVDYGKHIGILFKAWEQTWKHIYPATKFPFFRIWP